MSERVTNVSPRPPAPFILLCSNYLVRVMGLQFSSPYRYCRSMFGVHVSSRSRVFSGETRLLRLLLLVLLLLLLVLLLLLYHDFFVDTFPHHLHTYQILFQKLQNVS